MSKKLTILRHIIVYLVIVILPIISIIKFGFWITIGCLIVFLVMNSAYTQALEKSKGKTNDKT